MTIITVFFFNDTATTEIYTLSLHDALPICLVNSCKNSTNHMNGTISGLKGKPGGTKLLRYLTGPLRLKPSYWVRRKDRKSTRLNSSHANISYAVFCLKKKKHDRPLLRHEME